MNGKLYLIDGHALIFKMYYAFLRRPMVNSKGMDTSILFGFTKYLLELVEREKPTHLAVAFDPPGGTFRNEMYPEYKANRPNTPQLVIDALEPLTEIVKAMNIPVLMIPGFEADDVIGSMALRSAGEGFDVYMVTPDKDYGQLVRPHVYQLRPGKGGGDDELLDAAAVCAKYGIQSTSQVIDMLTICGDASDNVPGVKGVGEVGAAKLISKYGSVEEIYAHLDELSPRQQAMFEDARGHIALSKALVTIKTDIALSCEASDMAMDMAFSPVLADLFEKYEFNSLKRYIAHVAQAAPAAEVRKDFEVAGAGAAQLAAAARRAGRCAFVTEADGAGIFAPVTGVTVAVADGDRLMAASGGPADFKALLEDPSVEKFGFGIKLQLNRLLYSGISIEGRLVDVELIHYILNPERSHSLEILARSYLDVSLETAVPQAEAGSLFADDGPAAGEAHADRSREAAAILQLGGKVLAELEASGMTSL